MESSTLLRHLRIGELILTERATPAGGVIAAHGHERTTITFMVGGSCTERIGARSLDCGPRSVRILPAGEVHEQACPVDSRCLSIEVTARKMEEIRRFSRVFDRRLVLNRVVKRATGLTPAQVRASVQRMG